MIASGLDAIHATHGSKVSKPCSVNLQAQTYPVLYGGQPRNNPDGSFYPADAFYYLIRFSASPTCVGMNVGTLETHDGLDVESHRMVTWRSLGDIWNNNAGISIRQADPLELAKPHRHVDLGRNLERIEITHYYGDDALLFSIKEGGSITPSQQRQFERVQDSGHTKKTTEWDFITNRTHHEHYRECTQEALHDADRTYGGQIITYGGVQCRVPDAYVDEDSYEKFKNVIQNRCDTFRIYSGCIFGKVIIDADAGDKKCLYAELEKLHVPKSEFPDSDKCINLTQVMEQKVAGLKKTCVEESGRTICRNIPVVRTVSIRPDISVPDFEIILTHETLVDSDGYDARNLDGTYYTWDPITIRHIPDLKWKNHRANTIHFDVQKMPDLKMENKLDCSENTCLLNLMHPGMTASSWNLGNGDGLSIYNATARNDLGRNSFGYDITAYNGDTLLAHKSNFTDALVVRYEPEYSNYPYPALFDDFRTSYEDRAAVAIHYFGSLGGGPDDTTELHEDRRSKINDYAYAGVGYDPWVPIFFNDTLDWSEARDAGILEEHQQVTVNHPVTPSDNPDVVPCEAHGDTAMLVRAGYCRVYFEYPILDTVLGPAGPKYENATLFNTLVSDSFAGRDKTYLTNYEYRFPESLFYTILHVRSVGNNGTTHPIPLHAKVAYSDGHGVQSISEYIYEKIVHDSDDPGFGKTISQDVYPLEYSESDTGELQIKLRRIASKFETYGGTPDQNLTSLDIESLAPLYLANSATARLDVPFDVGLGALSPMVVYVTAAGTDRQYRYDYVDFGTDHHILVNVAQNNTLEITRHLGSVTITPHESFGGVEKLYVDGVDANVTCGATCVLSTPNNAQMEIMAENYWGGRAYAVAAEFVPEDALPVPSSNLIPIVVIALLAVPAYWAYTRLKGR